MQIDNIEIKDHDTLVLLYTDEENGKEKEIDYSKMYDVLTEKGDYYKGCYKEYEGDLIGESGIEEPCIVLDFLTYCENNTLRKREIDILKELIK